MTHAVAVRRVPAASAKMCKERRSAKGVTERRLQISVRGYPVLDKYETTWKKTPEPELSQLSGGDFAVEGESPPLLAPMWTQSGGGARLIMSSWQTMPRGSLFPGFGLCERCFCGRGLLRAN